MRSVRIRTTVAATTLLLASLALTACQGGSDDTGSGETDPSASVTVTATPSSGGSSDGSSGGKLGGTGQGAGKGTGSSGNSGNSGDSGTQGSGKGDGKAGSQGDGGGDAAGKSVTCTGGNTKVIASKVARPVNHLLLTATNTGSVPCAAYFAPVLQFDEDQAATAVNEDSKPQAVVMIDPGKSAYASVVLQGENPEGGFDAKVLRVAFTPRSGSGETGRPLNLNLPADTYKTNDAQVSYWQHEMKDALTF